MRTLELTDEEAAVLWFIGREIGNSTEMMTTRPNGRETLASLAGKLAALAIDDCSLDEDDEA